MVFATDEKVGMARRGDVVAVENRVVERIESGQIQSPIPDVSKPSLAGGTNHFPNSDLSFSTRAATVAGTVPGDAGDNNQEAWRFYWAPAGANVTIDAAHALKAVGHSLYAGEEGIHAGVPIWDRVNGWASLGATGAQYDIVVQLPRKVVGPGENWFFVWRIRALDATPVPSDVECFAGLWVKNTAAGYEGWAKGDPFDLSYIIEGAAGAQNIDYRVLAESDSGFAILSNVLNVPNAPTVLSTTDYPKIFYSAGPGFIKFTVYKKVGGVYTRVHEVRNSTDLQFNDIGAAGIAEAGWPVESDDRPLAYAQTGAPTLLVGPYGGTFAQNELHILIPGTYDSGATDNDGQFVRFGLLAPTGVDRHLAFDKFWWSTTFNAWAPDSAVQFTDANFTVPSVSPASGNPGSGGVFEPPDPGSGGGTCIVTRMPVKSRRSNRAFSYRRYSSVRIGDEIKGEWRLPYVALRKPGGTASEWQEITTANGIRYECVSRHRLVLTLEPRRYIQAQNVIPGVTKLMGETKGRNVATLVTRKRLIPKPCEVGTFILRHTGGQVPEGRGLYLAGFSKNLDRGLYSSNEKPLEN